MNNITFSEYLLNNHYKMSDLEMISFIMLYHEHVNEYKS